MDNTAHGALSTLIDQVVAASSVTHNTGIALAGAAAVAAAVSAGVSGAVAGACHGVGAFPPGAIAVIDAHGLDLAALADDLCALRAFAGSSLSC